MDDQKQQTIRILPRQLCIFAVSSAERIANIFVSLKFSPNFISLFALLLGMAAGALFVLGQTLWAGIVIILCGLFDVLDGQVASMTNRKSLFGAIFDSSLDRYAEFFIYLGLAYYFRNHWALWLCFITFFGALMVSYTRARAEGLGIECHVGIMQRAERMAILALGSLLGSIFHVFDTVMIAVLISIAAISNLTAFQRIFYVKKVEKSRNAEPSP